MLSMVGKVIEDFWSGIVAAIIAAGSWLVRRVLTNQKQIELLTAEIKHRDALREADRADIADVKNDVRDIKNVLLGKSV